MFLDLEFIKTCLNAITARFRRVKSDVEAVKSDAPNWNEPDTASHSYIKNKPCYDYIDPGVVIWASDSAEVNETEGSGVVHLLLADLVDGWLIEGETYRLTVNGVETTYICAADADGRGLYIGAGYSSISGSIFQPNTDTSLYAYAKNLWRKGQKVRLEGPLRRYKKLDTSLYDAVVSVNGEAGDVQITPENIGAAKAGSIYVAVGSTAYIVKAIYGTYDGAPCDRLYLGGAKWLARRLLTTGEECFALGPKDTLLAGIKTPTYADCAANKAYVDVMVASTRESIKLYSSTEGSAKQFELTVNDDGIISVAEAAE